MKALRKPRRAVSESVLVTAILKALQLKGIMSWRANSGTQVIGASGSSARRVIRGAPAGTPDILLTLPVRKLFAGTDTVRTIPEHAMLCGLEIKTATGKLQPSQIAWHAKAERHGVRVAVVTSISEALRVVSEWSGK